MLHILARRSRKEAHLFSQARYQLIDFSKRFKARQTLFLALDGPASLSKLKEQRRRRLENYSESMLTGKLDSQRFTPGCLFMTRFENFLKELVKDGSINAPRIVISGAACLGEGELKIYQELVKSYKQLTSPSSRAVLALDSDSYSLAITHGIPNTHVIIPTWEDGQAYGHFNVDDAISILRSQVNGKPDSQWQLDLALFCSFSGTDYLPGLRFGSYRTLWPAYCDSPLSLLDPTNCQLNLKSFQEFIRFYIRNHLPEPHKAWQEGLMKNSQRDPDKSHDRIISYLRTALSSVRTSFGFSNNICDDYTEEEGPNVGDFAEMDTNFVEKQLMSSSCDSKVTNLLPGAVAILTMNLLGKQTFAHLPKSLIPIAEAYESRKDQFKNDHEAAKWIHREINNLPLIGLSQIESTTIYPQDPTIITTNPNAIISEPILSIRPCVL